MFKRVEKRRRKKVEEGELGLDEDMKEILGMHDTDSDESDTDSDQSSTGDDNKGLEDLSEGDSFGEGLESNQDEDEEEHIITVQEALRDPVYLVSLQPDVKACIVCPGKLLKGAKMVDLHRTSKAHERRVKQFKARAVRSNPKENAWDIIRQNTEEHPNPSLTPSENSKRAQKRKAKLAAHQAKRAKQKAKLKSIKATAVNTKLDVVSDKAATHPQESPEPAAPVKKRRVDKFTQPQVSSSLDPGAPTSFESKSTRSTIKSIIRSTSERSKQARARSLKSSGDSQHPPRRKSLRK